MENFKPTKEDLRDATNRTMEDLIDYNLRLSRFADLYR
jgi:hypothetical protein